MWKYQRYEISENGSSLWRLEPTIGLIMKRKSHERTVGTMISTVCYLVLAAFFALQASDYLQSGYGMRGWGLMMCV